jgi:hypothetical protein
MTDTSAPIEYAFAHKDINIDELAILRRDRAIHRDGLLGSSSLGEPEPCAFGTLVCRLQVALESPE